MARLRRFLYLLGWKASISASFFSFFPSTCILAMEYYWKDGWPKWPFAAHKALTGSKWFKYRIHRPPILVKFAFQGEVKPRTFFQIICSVLLHYLKHGIPIKTMFVEYKCYQILRLKMIAAQGSGISQSRLNLPRSHDNLRKKLNRDWSLTAAVIVGNKCQNARPLSWTKTCWLNSYSTNAKSKLKTGWCFNGAYYSQQQTFLTQLPL